MSDEERDIDVESDEGDDSDSPKPGSLRQSPGSQYYSQYFSSDESELGRGNCMNKGYNGTIIKRAEKRAHHNALERKRRDHIKDSFSSLRDSVPALNGEKVASRAQILKKASEYIMFMRKKNSSHQQDIEDLKRQNSLLESQIRTLEKAKAAGSYKAEHLDEKEAMYETESDPSDMENSIHLRRPKKMKTSFPN